MKTWSASLKGTLTLSALSLLAFIGYAAMIEFYHRLGFGIMSEKGSPTLAKRADYASFYRMVKELDGDEAPPPASA